ncbi:MAG: AbrB/MazE/SpoVT family DNA-binding domain-containing protein [Brachymonas sp.]|nr:AbrB/MazE/SpoVT family DNA-binding domain-containing protein [Brachymonas sp.]NJS36990.1 AbrB/MazE/SpoVT family DNA-binding domain-containing protein [Brachymonas sp.]
MISASSTLAMSDNGRVLIPAELREKLGFKPKSPIFVEIKDGSLVLTSAQERMAQRRKYFADLMVQLNVSPERSLSEELIAERREEAKREAEGL